MRILPSGLVPPALALVALLSRAALAQDPVLTNSQALALQAFGTALFGPALLPSSWLQAENITDPTALLYVTADASGNVAELKILGIANGSRALPAVTSFTGLTSLSVPYNTITGLPTSVSLLGQLQRLDVSHNKLSGLLPAWITALPALTYLDMSYNKLTGPFIAAYTSLPLTYLSLKYNKLGGSIPTGWPASMTYLDLSFNFFGGAVKLKFGSSSAPCSALSLGSNCFVQAATSCSPVPNALASCNSYCGQGYAGTPCFGASNCVWSDTSNKFTCPSLKPPPPPCKAFRKTRCEGVDRLSCRNIPGYRALCVPYYNCLGGYKCECPHQWASNAQYKNKILTYCGPKRKIF